MSFSALFLRTLFVLYVAALHNPVFCSPPRPVNVSFSSLNLRNVLHWHPGDGTPPNTHFTVQYGIYGDAEESSKGGRLRWRAIQQCSDLGRSWCDLTNETWDLEHGYYARVRAIGKRGLSKWTVTRHRFDPKSDTIFGPPAVSVAMEGNSAIITLNGPMRYQPNNSTPEVSMAKMYSQMTYNLSVRISNYNQTHYFPLASSQHKHRLMEYNTEYCFSAMARFLSMPVTCQPSAWHCITTPRDPVIAQLIGMVIGIVVPSACIGLLLVAGYFICYSLRGKGQKRPHTLDLKPIHVTPLTFSPENLNLHLITVNSNKQPPGTKASQMDGPFPRPQQSRPGLPDLLSYTAQSPIENDFFEMEAVDYGFVELSHETVEKGREEEQIEGGRNNGMVGASWKGIERAWLDIREQREDDPIATTKRPECNACRYSGVRSFQGNSYLPQETAYTQPSLLTLAKPHHQMRTHTEAGTLLQTCQGSTQQHPVCHSSRSPLEELRGGEKAKGLLGEFKPDGVYTGTGLVNRTLLPRETNTGNNRQEKRSIDGEMEGGQEKGAQIKEVPRLSLYTPQYNEDPSTSTTERWDSSSDHSGFLIFATDREQDEEGEVEMAQINWCPETRTLLLGGWMQDERELEKEKRESVVGEERESQVRMEGVFVRQASEEERAAKGGAERGWATDPLLSNWTVVVHMDE